MSSAILRAWLPSLSATKSSMDSKSSEVRTKASRFPSGDQAGLDAE